MKATRLAAIRALADHHNGKGSKCVAMLLECVAEIQKLQRRREGTRGPTLSEVMQYGEEIGLTSGIAEDFFDHYQAVGWVYGKSRHPIRDFRAALRRWKRKLQPNERQKARLYGVGD